MFSRFSKIKVVVQNVKNVTVVPFCKTEPGSVILIQFYEPTTQVSVDKECLGFAGAILYVSNFSSRPSFTQKRLHIFVKVFKLLSELFKPILNHSFEPKNLLLVDSDSAWQKITASTKAKIMLDIL